MNEYIYIYIYIYIMYIYPGSYGGGLFALGTYGGGPFLVKNRWHDMLVNAEVATWRQWAGSRA